MPIRVTEIENRLSGATGLGGPNNAELNSINNAELNSINIEGDEIALMVEGTLYKRDAELLERICRDLVSQTKRGIKLDLSNLSFLDSDSAAVLCSLKRELGVSLEGLHLFIEKVVELAEESEKVEKYRPRTVNERVSQS
jgi:ABC-type transporter Mla MlaB component